MIAIILAAGYATRLYPLTLNRAKALLPVHGRPIIDYIVDQITAIPAIEQIVVVSNHRFADQFMAWRDERRHDQGESQPEILVLDDGTVSEADRLGAIGDIAFCIRTLGLDDDLLVVAGDNLFTFALSDAWQHFRHNGEDMILAQAMPPSDDLRRYAIVETDERGFVCHLEEKPDQPRTNQAVFAIYFYRRDTVPLFAHYLAEGNKPDAPGYFPTWLYRQKPVRVYFFVGSCFDIGTPEAYADVMTTFPVSVAREQSGQARQGVNPV
jgi:glucose-1-phosphate thymidylyltransferase